MTTRFRDTYFTSLDPVAAKKLASTLQDLLIPAPTVYGIDAGEGAPELGDDAQNLTVSSLTELRNEEEESLFDDDVAVVAESTVPSLEELRARFDAECENGTSVDRDLR